VIFDQTLVLQVQQSAKHDPESFRGIRYQDPAVVRGVVYTLIGLVFTASSLLLLVGLV